MLKSTGTLLPSPSNFLGLWPSLQINFPGFRTWKSGQGSSFFSTGLPGFHHLSTSGIVPESIFYKEFTSSLTSWIWRP